MDFIQISVDHDIFFELVHKKFHHTTYHNLHKIAHGTKYNISVVTYEMVEFEKKPVEAQDLQATYISH